MWSIAAIEKDEKDQRHDKGGRGGKRQLPCHGHPQCTIKRTALSAYRNVRKGGIIAINLEEGDELAWVRNTTGEDDLIIATRQGVAIRFAESDVRPMGRTATGVRAIRLDEGDEVIAMATCEEGGYLLTVTENGQGRRTALGEYRTQNRGRPRCPQLRLRRQGHLGGRRACSGRGGRCHPHCR